MTTLVLKEDVPLERIAQVLSALKLELRPTKPIENATWQLWLTSNEASTVHYVDDRDAKISYLSVLGERVRALTKKLRRELPIWERDDLLKHAFFTLSDGSENDIARVAMEVAADMDEYDAASAGVLVAFLEMDERTTRLAGARALRTRPWEYFRGAAERIANDTDPEVASVGKALLERIIELHGE